MGGIKKHVSQAAEFLTKGSVTLKKTVSPINGMLTVTWDSFGGYQILGGGLWQVGGPVVTVWENALKRLDKNDQFSSILILGLGGGTIAKILRRKYPESKIVGVDIDSVIVALGEEYMGLKDLHVKTYIEDAYLFLEKSKKQFDLICVDLYVGDTYPDKFENEEFVSLLKKRLNIQGTLVVNRLYYGQKRKLAEKFLKILKANFIKVEEVFSSIAENVVYISTRKEGNYNRI